MTTAALDRPNAALPVPDNLPRLDPAPVVWSVARRARMLHKDGIKALASHDLKVALSALAGAVQLDPSRMDARVDLARVYARAGRGSVALGLLERMTADTANCGGCIEGLRVAFTAPDLAALWASPRGRVIQKSLDGIQLPWLEWALRASQTLVDGTGKLLPGFIHANVPFVLARSCPSCSNPARRTTQLRELFGGRVAVKLASRFNTSDERLGGIPLTVMGSGTRQGRCVRWQIPKPVPVGTAALQQLCFRPITAKRAALTRIDIVYGRSKADLDR